MAKAKRPVTKSTTVHFRVTEREREAYERAALAAKHGALTVSAWARRELNRIVGLDRA